MNWPNLREASTKRGLVWIVGGIWIVVQAFRGKAVNSDDLFNKLDFWLGVIMTIAGGFGLLPDVPKTVELPPISLQGRSESGDAGAGAVADRPAHELRVPASHRPESPTKADPITYPNFHTGFGDRD